ncbi:stage III sporulation protein AF [Paenibacillus solisilvae]|uniref:Stage III sporulation protein AF n=1 Tax=Paenibacillus solisilvae TaxID=2486751 RepID=A0ABW0W3D2_9BACL
MLDWLSSWLQQIIAVVLLAGLIDLLLPNKAMQRYVRLVAGLIILLTIMTPIIRVLQGDFNAKLDQDVEGWFQGVQSKDMRMPTLEDIKKDADVIKKNQQTSALTLTQNKLSEEMRQKIEQRTGREVEDVALQLQVVTTGVTEGAVIKSVAVTMSAKPKSPEKTGQSPVDGTEAAAGDGPAVEEVESIAVSVQVEPDAASSAGNQRTEGFTSLPADSQLAQAITQLLQDSWSVAPGIVSIRERQDDESTGP